MRFEEHEAICHIALFESSAKQLPTPLETHNDYERKFIHADQRKVYQPIEKPKQNGSLSITLSSHSKSMIGAFGRKVEVACASQLAQTKPLRSF